MEHNFFSLRMAYWKSRDTLSWIGKELRHPCTNRPVSSFLFSPGYFSPVSWWGSAQMLSGSFEETLNVLIACLVLVLKSESLVLNPNAAYCSCNVSFIRKWRHVKCCAQGCRQGHEGSAGDWFLTPHVKTQVADNELQTHEPLHNILLDWYLK